MGAENTLFLDEALNLISSTTLNGVLYGIVFTLYCLCSSSLYLRFQKSDKRRRAKFTLGYISLLLICSTGFLALNARMIQLAYINNADFPGGPPGFEASYSSTTNAFDVAGGTLDFIIEVLTMAIQIRRLWIIWSGTQYAIAVTILPLLLFLCNIALDIPVGIVIGIIPLDHLGISGTSAIGMETATYAVLSTFTILVTGLIAVRLLLARRQHIKIMPGMSEAASPYLGIVAMLVGSYALDSVWSLATAITFSLASPIQYMFGTNDSTIKIIAYFLVVYRVETGQGWTKQTDEKLTTLQWNRGVQAEDNEISGIRSPATATASVIIVDSLPLSNSHTAS